MWLTVLAVCLIHFAMAASFVPRGGSLDRPGVTRQHSSVIKKALKLDASGGASGDRLPKEFLLHCREEDDLCGMYLNITEGGISFIGPTS